MTGKRVDEKPQSGNPSSGSQSSENPTSSRPWAHLRPKFDSAVGASTFTAVFSKLLQCGGETNGATAIAAEVSSLDAVADQSKYLGGVLAIRKAFRDLPKGHNEGVAQAICGMAALVPTLNDALAGEIVLALGNAAKNDSYLDCVEGAINLLLKPDSGISEAKADALRSILSRISARKELLKRADESGQVFFELEPILDALANHTPDNSEQSHKSGFKTSGASYRDSELRAALNRADESRQNPRQVQLSIHLPAKSSDGTDDAVQPPEAESETAEGRVPGKSARTLLSYVPGGSKILRVAAVVGAFVVSFGLTTLILNRSTENKPVAHPTKPSVMQVVPHEGVIPATSETSGEPWFPENTAQPTGVEPPVQEPEASGTAPAQGPGASGTGINTDSPKESKPAAKPLRSKQPEPPTFEEIIKMLETPLGDGTDTGENRAGEIAAAIGNCAPADAQRVFASIGTNSASEAADSGVADDAKTAQKTILMVSVLRHVALGPDLHKATNAIARLGELAGSGGSEAVQALESLNAETKIIGSRKRNEALVQALLVAGTAQQ